MDTATSCFAPALLHGYLFIIPPLPSAYFPKHLISLDLTASRTVAQAFPTHPMRGVRCETQATAFVKIPVWIDVVILKISLHVVGPSILRSRR